jgi:hypothetical protein
MTIFNPGDEVMYDQIGHPYHESTGIFKKYHESYSLRGVSIVDFTAGRITDGIKDKKVAGYAIYSSSLKLVWSEKKYDPTQMGDRDDDI